MQETIAQLEKKQKEAGTYTGYFKIDGEYYCLDENGKPRTGDITLTVNGVSNQYYFEENSTIPGRMFHEGWRQVIDSKGNVGSITAWALILRISVNIISVV